MMRCSELTDHGSGFIDLSDQTSSNCPSFKPHPSNRPSTVIILASLKLSAKTQWRHCGGRGFCNRGLGIPNGVVGSSCSVALRRCGHRDAPHPGMPLGWTSVRRTNGLRFVAAVVESAPIRPLRRGTLLGDIGAILSPVVVRSSPGGNLGPLIIADRIGRLSP